MSSPTSPEFNPEHFTADQLWDYTTYLVGRLPGVHVQVAAPHQDSRFVANVYWKSSTTDTPETYVEARNIVTEFTTADEAAAFRQRIKDSMGHPRGVRYIGDYVITHIAYEQNPASFLDDAPEQVSDPGLRTTVVNELLTNATSLLARSWSTEKHDYDRYAVSKENIATMNYANISGLAWFALRVARLGADFEHVAIADQAVKTAQKRPVPRRELPKSLSWLDHGARLVGE